VSGRCIHAALAQPMNALEIGGAVSEIALSASRYKSLSRSWRSFLEVSAFSRVAVIMSQQGLRLFHWFGKLW